MNYPSWNPVFILLETIGSLGRWVLGLFLWPFRYLLDWVD